jgi:xanthine/uracil permease
MNALITLGLIAGLPIVLLMVLRINATLVFLSLCLGNLLVQFLGSDAHSLLDLAAKRGHSTNMQAIQLSLLLIPVVLTSIFMLRSVKGHAKLMWNLLPALATGIVGALLVVPLLPGGSQQAILSSNYWQELIKVQSLVVALATLICLLFLWMQRPKHEKEGKHHGHH